MRARALVLASAAVLLVAGTTAAFADLTPAATGSAAAAASAPRANGFERPAAGAAYPLSGWANDGWTADWEVGMDERARIDTQHKHSGSKSLRVFYPKGQIDPAKSGISAPFNLTPGREYYVSQWVRFSPDFSFGTTQSGGKLGVGLGGGKACSGGEPCNGYNGFTSRLIWKSFGKAAVYYYSMDHKSQYGDYAQLEVNGAEVSWPRGQWINVVQRVRVNTVSNGNANPDGEIQVWYNGAPAATVSGLRFVRNGDLVDRAYFSSFFGGATTEFAPANDSWIWYDDLKVSTNRADICELNPGGCAATPPTRPATPAPTTTKPTTAPTAKPPTTPTGARATDAWAPYEPYPTGRVVSYNGTRYRCLQAHTSFPGWQPANVAALWKAI
jgi:hypothetical protein